MNDLQAQLEEVNKEKQELQEKVRSKAGGGGTQKPAACPVGPPSIAGTIPGGPRSSPRGWQGGEGTGGADAEAACPQLQALQSQLEFLEQSMVDKSLVSRQEAKIRELETRLEFERTQVKRLEVGAGTPLTGSGWVRHPPSPHGTTTASRPRHEAAQGSPGDIPGVPIPGPPTPPRCRRPHRGSSRGR